jgi:ribonucleoside-diphosphate reductase alpha chain
MLATMGIPYDSHEAIEKAGEVGEFFDRISLDESRKLGRDRGNFGFFEGSVFDGVETSMRNSDRTTIAPTGTTSLYAMCSSGIEPLFSPVTVRDQADMVQVDYHPALFDMLKRRNLDTPEIRNQLAKSGGSVRHSEALPSDIKSAFPTAHDISPEWHIRHQMAWQQHITSAVSKTINMPKEASSEDVDRAYRMAYEGGCKGITVYRDGTRKYQPLRHSKTEPNGLIQIGKRTDVTHGSNRKVPNGCGNLMVYVGGNEDGVHEITARVGKGGGCASAQTEAIARMASIAMQHGAEPERIAKQLNGIRCHLTAMHRSTHTDNKPRIVTSCGDAISVALSEHMADIKGEKANHKTTNDHVGACTSCGASMAFEEGCAKCYNCGYSRC